MKEMSTMECERRKLKSCLVSKVGLRATTEAKKVRNSETTSFLDMSKCHIFISFYILLYPLEVAFPFDQHNHAFIYQTYIP